MISGSMANSAARAANGRLQVSANCHCLRRQGETMGEVWGEPKIVDLKHEKQTKQGF